jgi:hypothetical protein
MCFLVARFEHGHRRLVGVQHAVAEYLVLQVIDQRLPLHAAQPDTDTVMHQHLHPVGSAVGKQVGLMGVDCAEDFDYAGQGGVGSGSHVHGLGSQPNSIDTDHRKQRRPVAAISQR